MKEVHILVGMPAAGKSTHIDRVKAANPDVRIEVLSSDNYIEEKAASEGKTYNEVFTKYANDASKHVMIRAKQLAKDDSVDIIMVDRTNLTKKSRQAFIDIFKDTCELHAFIFPTPEKSEHERRLASRPGKNIPDFVLKNMRESYVAPSVDEGFDSIWFLRNDYE